MSSTGGAPAAVETEPIDADQSLAELIGRMTTDVGALLNTQLELAKVEIKEELRDAAKGAGLVGGGGVAGLLATLLISFALAYWIGDLLDSVAAGFAIVGLVMAVVAVAVMQKGRQQLRSVTPVAEQTKTTLKEDLEWARQQTS